MWRQYKALADDASHLADLFTLKHILRPNFDVESPNAVHQADLFLSHDKATARSQKVNKYTLTVVDVASRFKAAEPLSSKDSSEVSKAFQTIYRCGPLRWPKVLQVDPRHEFMGEVTTHDVRIRRGNVNIYRNQGIIERFNWTFSDCLFTFQYSQEMNFKEGKRST